MLNIIIVEDEVNEAQRLSSFLFQISEEYKTEFKITHFANGLDLLSHYPSDIDLIFLDINMPLIDGMTLAKEIRKIDVNVSLVFVTNLANYAIEGYEVEALDFILKPVNYYDFALKMTRIISRIALSKDEKLIIKTKDEEVGVPISKIKYFEVQGHYVTFHCLSGVYSEYITLKEIQKILTREKGFVQCNRSFIINARFIDTLKGDFVIIGKEKLPISRTFKKDLFNYYAKYLSGGYRG